MKLNRGGLKLCAAYIVFVILMTALAYFTPDPKTRFFLSSLASFPAGMTFAILKLYPLLYQHPWTRFVGIPVSVLITYLIGWLVSAIRSHRKVKQDQVLARQLADAKENNR